MRFEGNDQVAILNAEAFGMDVLVQETENGINLLRGRRITLISDAMTRKIGARLEGGRNGLYSRNRGRLL